MEENGLNIRRICRIRIPLPKKSIGWAVGDEKTRPVVIMAGIDHIFGGQDGRVVKAPSLIAENGLKYTPDMCGIEILFPQKSP